MFDDRVDIRPIQQQKKHAEREYRAFVKAGTREKEIWEAVRGQSILGGNEFVKGLIGYIKGYKDIKEIPKRQRYINRPELGKIFKSSEHKRRGKRDRKMRVAVENYGYNQKEVADYLGIHYSTVSRIVNKDS